MLGAQLFVAFDLDLGHHFKAGLEMETFALVNVQIGYARLGDGDKALPLGFLAKVFGNKRVHNIVLNVLREALPDDRGGHVAAAEPGNPGQLAIFLNQSFGFARDFFSWNLDFDFASRVVYSFGWTHV
jgi:hypothetical protein